MARSEAPVVVPGWQIADARGPLARARGLLGRRGLPSRHGLWLRARSVHTVGMRFALDLVWVDSDGEVVRVDEDVGPGRVRSCRSAHGVVELAVGQGPALAVALSRRCVRDTRDASGESHDPGTRSGVLEPPVATGESGPA